MGKQRRARLERRARRHHQGPKFEGHSRIPAFPEDCPECGVANTYYLCTSLGIARCDCGWQGIAMVVGEDGRAHAMVPEEEGPCEVRKDKDGNHVISLALGPCTIHGVDGGIVAVHEYGTLVYSPWGDLIEATGMFAREHLLAPRPPPCVCGSFEVEWVDGPAGHSLLADAAERMGRRLVPHRCEDVVRLEIEGFGGRAARCLHCRKTGVFPTYSEQEQQWRDDVSSTKLSVFVSYGGPDEGIAARIVHALTKKGIRVWFFPRDARPGEKLHRTMFQAVNDHDRILLLCSRASLERRGVQNELERVLERESREGGSSILIPVSLDRYVYDEWAPERPDIAQQVRDRVICSFVEALEDGWVFNEKIDQLAALLAKSDFAGRK